LAHAVPNILFQRVYDGVNKDDSEYTNGDA